MASPSAIAKPELGFDSTFLLQSITQPLPVLLATALIIAVSYSWWNKAGSKFDQFPRIHGAKSAFMTSARSFLARARAQYPGQPVRMNTQLGDSIVLPHQFIDEIKSDPRISVDGTFRRMGLRGIPGFEPIISVVGDGHLLQAIAKNQLTKLLTEVTEPLSEEMALAASVNFGESAEWHELALKPVMLDVVARISSRVFLGGELCRDDAWLTITKEYTVTLSRALNTIAYYPAAVRRLVHWFVPDCRILRAQFAEARRVIAPVIARRDRVKREARDAGEEPPRFNDALEWIDHEAAAKGCAYDMTTLQTMLSVAAIHTTTDLLSQIMIHLAQDPELTKRARDEIVSTLRADGWTKGALYNMKLLDSIAKETQRLKPIGVVMMRRCVEDDFRLSTGATLRKGTQIIVDAHRMRDPEVYEDPEVWDGSRFLKLRSHAGKERTAQLVTTSPDHFAFGHGEHACPGRFFAASEVKVALCHMLVKYEWKLAPGTDTAPVYHGNGAAANPAVRVLVRKRETTELDIDDLRAGA
ncbi:cytochrome P450 [Xylariomycetidae sp. FL2044]|nr:cytochrome P450 [Xylariomycetidae sp. FL2044]